MGDSIPHASSQGPLQCGVICTSGPGSGHVSRCFQMGELYSLRCLTLPLCFLHEKQVDGWCGLKSESPACKVEKQPSHHRGLCQDERWSSLRLYFACCGPGLILGPTMFPEHCCLRSLTRLTKQLLLTLRRSSSVMCPAAGGPRRKFFL